MQQSGIISTVRPCKIEIFALRASPKLAKLAIQNDTKLTKELVKFGLKNSLYRELNNKKSKFNSLNNQKGLFSLIFVQQK